MCFASSGGLHNENFLFRTFVLFCRRAQRCAKKAGIG